MLLVENILTMYVTGYASQGDTGTSNPKGLAIHICRYLQLITEISKFNNKQNDLFFF
jgi:hypothetical protein